MGSRVHPEWGRQNGAPYKLSKVGISTNTETLRDRTSVCMTLIESRIWVFDWDGSRWPWMTLNSQFLAIVPQFALYRVHTELFWEIAKIDCCYQQQKCSPRTLFCWCYHVRLVRTLRDFLESWRYIMPGSHYGRMHACRLHASVVSTRLYRSIWSS